MYAARFQGGAQLYAGDYLPDALYEDWATAERERLPALYLRAAERLANIRLQLERHDEALHDELAVDPSPATVALHNRIAGR
jgi:DNA-binding SARP family transcriptional activator